jgi:hypothetical protein
MLNLSKLLFTEDINPNVNLFTLKNAKFTKIWLPIAPEILLWKILQMTTYIFIIK